MKVNRANRISQGALIVLSLAALLPILYAVLRILVTGQVPPPARDEGAGAHIFQLSIALLVPASLAFVATADWRRLGRVLRTLIMPVVAVALAFVLLYHYEHP